MASPVRRRLVLDGGRGIEALRWLGVLALGAAAPAARHLSDGVPARAAGLLLAAVALVILGAVLPPRRWAFEVRLAATGGAVLLMPEGAHRAMALAGTGLLAGHAALADRRRRTPSGGVVVARLSIALSVAASITWIRAPRSSGVDDARHYGLAVAVALVLHLLALLAAELRTRLPACSEAVEAAVARAVARLGVAVAAAVLFVVALPLLYLPGLIGRLASARPGRRPPTTSWHDRRGGTNEDRRHAAHPFAATPVRDRRRRFLQAAGVAAVGALVAGGIRWRADEGAPDPAARQVERNALDDQRDIRFSDLPAYRGVAFADDLKAEQDELAGSLVPDPVTGFTVPDFAGTYTNTVGGVRRTIRPTCACPEATVWLVGGSVAFGLGQRDDHTIASNLVRLAEADGIALHVLALGVPGWTIAQERAAVAARLATTAEDQLPDVVVSYGGFNDVVGTILATGVHGFQPDEPSVLDSSDVLEFERRQLTIADAGGVDALAALAVARYRRVQEAMSATARDVGVGTAYFFEPDALASPQQFAPVAELFRGVPVSEAMELGRVLGSAASQLAGTTTNLRDIFDEVEQSVFVDWAHTNERGAEVAADQVWRVLAAEVKRAAYG